MTSILSTMPAEWAIVQVRQIVEVIYGSGLPAKTRTEHGNIPVYASGGIVGYHDEALHTESSIIIGRKGTVGSIQYVEYPFWAIDTTFYLDNISPSIDIEFLVHMLRYTDLSRFAIVVGVPGISRKDIERQNIPLPPLSEQRRIVAILRKADELLRLRREAQREAQALLPALFEEMFGDPNQWQKPLKLAECVTFVGGGTPSRKVTDYFSGEIPWATSKDIKSRYLDDAEEHITEDAILNSATNLVPPGTILVVVKSKILVHTLPVSITTKSFCFGQDIKGMICHEGYEPQFVAAAILAQTKDVLVKARGVNTEGLTLEILQEVSIPRIEPEQQSRFIRQVSVYDKLENNKGLAARGFETLFSSLLARAFSGELTAAWRERHHEQLATEAVQRDRLLAERGVARAQMIRPPSISTEAEVFLPTVTTHDSRDAVLDCLSAEQREIWQAVEESDGYLNAEVISQSHDLPLARARQTLELFAAAGLLLPVSLRNSEVSNFVLAYRRLRSANSDGQPCDESYADDVALLEVR
ncbi:MAG: hypothetical protein EI684_09230 [Candidatus Viridilinea halotolerans]|uniref:Type I restriction modification DNA specificity domain-containing protein n=1 Tax=Candidatus Viridilinea halotolerans TaxID=2491704 RepID=A0A426U1B9_9CHLR|nr:MAG: hypothetical protein EI684_09230 [Candidatus Viridilinea halotolerans]